METMIREDKDNEVCSEVGALIDLDNAQVVKRSNVSPFWKQTFAATASILGAFSAGCTSGYSAILLPQLDNASSAIVLTQEVSSWIAAMSPLPLGFANIVSGFLMERVGRRLSHIILCIPFIVGWIIIAVANNLFVLLIGRFITGFCQGLHGPLGSIYVGEISSPNNRGFFLAGISLAVALGIFLSHFIGTFLSWKHTALICSIPPFFCMLLMMLSPETPSWLASHDRHMKAIKSFKWLRGQDKVSNNELRNLLSVQIQRQKSKDKTLSLRDKLTSFRLIFTKEEFYKPLLIMVGYFIMAQFSGINVITFYTATIMQSVLDGGFSAYNAMIIADVSRVIMSVIACILSRRFGRRPLTVISGVLTMLSLYALSLYLYLNLKGIIVINHSWIPISLIVLYIVSSSIGIIPLPWMMVGEVFPVAARGIGSGISVCTTSIAFFVSIKIAPAMFSGLGMHGTFFFYGCVSLIGTIALYKFLPETKDKTLQEIEENFKK